VMMRLVVVLIAISLVIWGFVLWGIFEAVR
jgi:hypothetical protein